MNEVTETENLALKRLHEATKLAELTEGSVFALTAEPTPSSRFPSLFAGEDSSVVRTFNNPPQLRRAGFDLEHGGNSRMVRGDLRRAVVQGWNILELWRDGMLIYAVDATVQPCWGSPTSSGALRVNQLALVEPVYLFVELSRRIYRESTVKPRFVVYRVFFQRIAQNGKPAILCEGPIGDAGSLGRNRAYFAPDSKMERTITWEQPEIDTGAVAFQLLQEVYHWFGISDEGIPYARKRSDGRTVIDPEDLIKAGNS
jgi:hypothetical protein